MTTEAFSSVTAGVVLLAPFAMIKFIPALRRKMLAAFSSFKKIVKYSSGVSRPNIPSGVLPVVH